MNLTDIEVIPNFNNNIREGLKFSLQFVKTSSNIIIIKPIGSINIYNAAYFQDRINMIIDHGYTQLVFNMADIKYVSATGIGSFMHILNSVKKYGGNIALVEMQYQVLEVFQLPGFAGSFTIYSDISSAVLSFDGSEVTGG